MYTKENNKDNPYLKERDDLFCKYCGRQCKNLNALKNHECRCKNNPNRKVVSTPFDDKEWRKKYWRHSKTSWNKGLTKESDVRLQRSAEKLSQIFKGKPHGRGKTNEIECERKRKISESMKANPKAGGKRHGSGRGHKGWYKGFFCDSTYELAYVVYNLDHDINFKRCTRRYEYEYKSEKHYYYPDFELEDGSLVEIKGFVNDVTQIKLASVNDRPITLLMQKDLQYAFDYVLNTYKCDTIEELYEEGYSSPVIRERS